MYKEVKASERLPEESGMYHCIDDREKSFRYFAVGDSDMENYWRKYITWLEKTPQQNAEELFSEYSEYAMNDKGVFWYPKSVIKMMLEQYVQSTQETSEEEIKVEGCKCGYRRYRINKDCVKYGGACTENDCDYWITESTQPQPKEEEKCKHGRREKVRDLKGWYCLDCGYDHITYERG
jgi:hypothetical protein